MKKKPTPKPRFVIGADPPQRLSSEAKKKLLSMKPAKKAVAEAATVVKFMTAKRSTIGH